MHKDCDGYTTHAEEVAYRQKHINTEMERGRQAD
jgi:hypothetical protein